MDRINMEKEYTEEQLRARFNPDGSLLRRQQNRMMELLLTLDAFCRRHGLRYWLIGGTLIGAVRHHGFIPWDDDMDVQMPREDYLRLVELMPKELDKNTALQCRQTDDNYFFQYAKLRDRRSRVEEYNGYDRLFKEQGVFIDIFPIDAHTKWAHRLANKVFGHVYKYVKQTHLSDEVVCRKVKRWTWLCEHIVFPLLHAINRPFGRIWLDAYGVPYIIGWRKDDMLPLTTLPFEGHDMPVPRHYDKILRYQYGDYMQLPNLDKVGAQHFSRMEISD